VSYLAATFIATGALWSGVKDGGIAFGAIVGATFALAIGGSLLIAYLAGEVPPGHRH